jgi:AcrR family transcriptional regulator
MTTVRDRLLDAAEALIYQNGIHATGTEAILARAEVARMSLYNQFGSKEALVLAALERRDDRWMAWFRDGIEARAADATRRLPAIFDQLAEWFDTKDFHGCAFINVSGEQFAPDHPARLVARRHKARLRQLILELCQEAGIGQPDTLARHLFLLVEGAIVAAMVEPGCAAAEDGKQAALMLLGGR